MTKTWRFNDWRMGSPTAPHAALVTDHRGGAGRARFEGEDAPPQWFPDVEAAHVYALTHGWCLEGGYGHA